MAKGLRVGSVLAMADSGLALGQTLAGFIPVEDAPERLSHQYVVFAALAHRLFGCRRPDTADER